MKITATEEEAMKVVMAVKEHSMETKALLTDEEHDRRIDDVVALGTQPYPAPVTFEGATPAEVLSHLVAYRNVADIVQYHHERLDGSGYPLGARSAEIPELSKILAVADSYHAMTSDRPYRRAMSSFEALKVLRASAGTTLERTYVEILATILRDKDLAYRDGTSTDFMGEYERGRISLRLRGAMFDAERETESAVRDQGDPAAV